MGDSLAPYRAVLASRVRAQRSYRGNFLLDLASSLLVGFVELAEVWVVFHNVDRLGGLDLTQILLVFGLADLSFSLADLAFGHCDNLPTYLRAGTLDVFYLRLSHCSSSWSPATSRCAAWPAPRSGRARWAPGWCSTTSPGRPRRWHCSCWPR